jgi:hypothetical protein
MVKLLVIFFACGLVAAAIFVAVAIAAAARAGSRGGKHDLYGPPGDELSVAPEGARRPAEAPRDLEAQDLSAQDLSDRREAPVR